MDKSDMTYEMRWMFVELLFSIGGCDGCLSSCFLQVDEMDVFLSCCFL